MSEIFSGMNQKTPLFAGSFQCTRSLWKVPQHPRLRYQSTEPTSARRMPPRRRRQVEHLRPASRDEEDEGEGLVVHKLVKLWGQAAREANPEPTTEERVLEELKMLRRLLTYKLAVEEVDKVRFLEGYTGASKIETDPPKSIFGTFDDFVESLFEKVFVVVYGLGVVVLLVGLALWVSVLCVELFNFSVNTKNVR